MRIRKKLLNAITSGQFTKLEDFPSTFSTEIRWFCQLDIPVGILNHFVEFNQRTDHYRIPLPKGNAPDQLITDHIGVKWREGNLEAKVRQSGRDLNRKIMHGKIESWIKHNLGQYSAPVSRDNQEWIKVGKSRSLRSFRFFENQGEGYIEEVNEFIEDHGCNVELTKLHLEPGYGVGWWTFGLEAFSKNHELTNSILIFTLDHIIDLLDLKTGEFIYNHSMGYPEWINTLLKRDQGAPSQKQP